MFWFFQKEYEHPMVKRARAILGPQKLYLETASIFHQMFNSPNLDYIRTVETTLNGHCNIGTTTSNKKVMYLHVFDMWLVRNFIANILSVPRLEKRNFAKHMTL